MILESIRAFALTIPFNAAFRHASAERSATQTVWIEARARDGVVGFGEGCPREYVTAESLQSAHAFVAGHLEDWLRSIHDVKTLAGWVASHGEEIDANPAAWTAVELALLDALGKSEGKPVESLIGVSPLAGDFRYTAVLGDAAPRQFAEQVAHYRNAGFSAFKIKLSGDTERDLAKVRALAAAGIAAAAVRADANNLWSDAPTAIERLRALEFPFFALEEPLRARDYEGMRRVAQSLGSRIILDESLLRAGELERLAGPPEGWIVNLRVSKMGGLLRSLELARAARERHVSVIVGAHVGETSLLTRAGLTVANAARDILAAQEGAFGTHLLASDVVDAPLMFGRAGILDTDSLGVGRAPGLGLVVSRTAGRLAPLVTPS